MIMHYGNLLSKHQNEIICNYQSECYNFSKIIDAIKILGKGKIMINENIHNETSM